MAVQDWEHLNALLVEMFHDLNDGQHPKQPPTLWQDHGTAITELLTTSVAEQFVEIGTGVWSPRAYEAIRLLADLRQRRDRAYGADSIRLVDQLRVEAVIRNHPIRNILAGNIQGQISPILADIGKKPTYSAFQLSGWRDVWNTILQRDKSVIIVAPTGSGKTEVFLLPTIYKIASELQNPIVPHFVLIYPRVELLKDQIARVFRYAYRAEQKAQVGSTNFANQHKDVNHPFVIGLQYGSIRSTYQDTLENRELFDANRKFLTVPMCPICDEEHRQGALYARNANGKIIPLECDNQECGAVFHVTIGKNDHAEARIRPQILITTIESLDRLYLNPKLEPYISNIDGLIFDEVHLYHALYGAHVHNIIARIDRLNQQTHGRALFKIASSATVSSPERFAARLFYGRDEDDRVDVIDAIGFPSEPVGIETVLFLQTTESDTFARTQSTLIQTVMAVGHGILNSGDRTLVFTESIDHADRSVRQIRDAELADELWRFRTVTPDILFENAVCPRTNPALCSAVYLYGECWRGVKGGLQCYMPQTSIIERPLSLDVIHSKHRGNYWGPDVIIATPVLEVGVDDERFRATVHYRPPRSVFSFLQRRGRAGRAGMEIAYSVLVLGRTAADEFYFRRRNRLMDAGEYELPLNPNNEVVRQMHLHVEQERAEIRRLIQQPNSIPKALLLWTIEKYRQCPTLNAMFGSGSDENFLTTLWESTDRTNDYREIQAQQERFRNWIIAQRARFLRHVELDVLLAELVARAPETARGRILAFRELIHAWRNQEVRDYTAITNLALELNQTLEILAVAAEDVGNQLEADMHRRLQERIREIRRDQNNIGILQADEEVIPALYDFFNLLHTRIIEETYRGILNRAEDMSKIVLQSLFYIGNYCIAHSAGCPVCTEYFIPDAYFQEVKPITIETWTNSGRRLEEMHVEDATKLSTMLLPYKTFYRYFSERDYMAVVRTTTQSNWVRRDSQGTEVRLEMHLEGVRRNGGIYPNKIHVVPVRPDRTGQGIVKLCLNCYRLHSEDYQSTACTCNNGQIIPVRLRSEPIIRRDAHYENPERLSDTFWYSDNLTGIVSILGAEVEYSQQIQRANIGYVATNNRASFQALYFRNGDVPQPIIYDIRTHGIIWDLAHVVDVLLHDSYLGTLVDQYQNKTFGADLILHTAAHILHKAIASISGINDVTLEYAILSEHMRVVVWERMEGGVGISEIIRDTLLEEPKRLYRELLASVLCPVYFSEDVNSVNHEIGRNEHRNG